MLYANLRSIYPYCTIQESGTKSICLSTASETDRSLCPTHHAVLKDSQRYATRFILSLAFRCESSETSYKNQILKANLLPLSYWHEYLDSIPVLFKAMNLASKESHQQAQPVSTLTVSYHR